MTDHNNHMERAIALARKSVAEDDRQHPKVGAVLVDSQGKVICEAHRGEVSKGDHAEFTALEKKLKDPALAVGATVYTTLEPCTTRNHPKVPCVQRLIDAEVRSVFIGMLDPNPAILGRGVLALRQAGIRVELFPHEFMTELEKINAGFLDAHPLPPLVTRNLVSALAQETIDEWYARVNRTYWSRNFQRNASAIFTHLVEVIGNLSVLVSKKGNIKPEAVAYYLAKAIAWWLALCGKVGVRSVSDMLWGKFPGVCPYCLKNPHIHDVCRARKQASRGPDWKALQALANATDSPRPQSVAQWQQMFASLYPPTTTEDFPPTFAKLTEEIGELAEAIRVFPAAPGYFLSEAADVFAWLMKLNNIVERDADPDKRGLALQDSLAESYPARCRDCNMAVCSCAPILPSTIGRLAHEVPDEFVSFYDTRGSFLTAELLSKAFGPKK